MRQRIVLRSLIDRQQVIESGVRLALDCRQLTGKRSNRRRELVDGRWIVRLHGSRKGFSRGAEIRLDRLAGRERVRKDRCCLGFLTVGKGQQSGQMVHPVLNHGLRIGRRAAWAMGSSALCENESGGNGGRCKVFGYSHIESYVYSW